MAEQRKGNRCGPTEQGYKIPFWTKSTGVSCTLAEGLQPGDIEFFHNLKVGDRLNLYPSNYPAPSPNFNIRRFMRDGEKFPDGTVYRDEYKNERKQGLKTPAPANEDNGGF